jgi:hypothetical protein
MAQIIIQLPDGLSASDILSAARRNGVKSVRVFGSRARGEARSDSDLDLLVELESGRDLFDLIGLKLDLESKTDVKVEVLTTGFLSPHFRKAIESEAVRL